MYEMDRRSRLTVLAWVVVLSSFLSVSGTAQTTACFKNRFGLTQGTYG